MKRPLIIAHRGASRVAPENTLLAFQKALDQKADGLELDIFLTRDREVVVCHDENLKKLTGRKVNIRKVDRADLRSLRVHGKEPIPTLREVFGEFGKKFQIINVEIKSTGFLSDGIEAELLKLIREFRLTDKILVSSFNPVNLWRTRFLDSKIRLGQLVDAKNWFTQSIFWGQWLKATSFNLPHQWCTAKRFEKYAETRLDIWLWTVDQEKDIRKWAQKPVKALITNEPAYVRKVLKSV